MPRPGLNSHRPLSSALTLTLALALALTPTLGCQGIHNDQSTMGTLSMGETEYETDALTDALTDGTSDGSNTGTVSQSGTASASDTGSTGATNSTGETTTGADAQCGNGEVESGEACDDGNGDNTDDCLNTCTMPFCGDGYTHIGVEDCDDGNADDSDDCTSTCEAARCGDGLLHAEIEQCDDGNNINTDDCLNTCIESYCGDGFLNMNVGEVCDDGLNNNEYGSCSFDCKERMEHCGDKIVQKEHSEMCDTDSPTAEVPCTSDCKYDFSGVKQLYCFGTCTWAGPWHCDKEDADLFCRLLTGNPDSEAAPDFEIVEALDTSGLACAKEDVLVYNPDDPPMMPGDNEWEDPRIDLEGPLEDYGVFLEHVYFIEYSVKETHGPNDVILPPNCSNP